MSVMLFKKLTNNAVIPYKKYRNSPGFELLSAYDIVVKKNSTELILFDLEITIPENYYGFITSNIDEGLNITITVHSRIIESKSDKNIGILLKNHGEKDFIIKRGQSVGLLLLSKIVKNIETFEIMDFLPEEPLINLTQNIDKNDGHDVVDRLGCQIPNCKKCKI